MDPGPDATAASARAVPESTPPETATSRRENPADARVFLDEVGEPLDG
jgi:hypothetical protein